MNKTNYTIIGIAAVIIIVLVIAYATKPVVAPTNDTNPQTGTSNTIGNIVNGNSTGTTISHSSGTTKNGSTIYTQSANTQTLPTYYGDSLASSTSEISVANPPQNTTVNSPLTVTGQAKGSWFFEGVFPIYLYNKSGLLIGQSHVRATSDWTTSDSVPFIGTITFPRQFSGSTGRLVLKNDNPSGLPQNSKAVQMTVTFQ